MEETKYDNPEEGRKRAQNAQMTYRRNLFCLLSQDIIHTSDCNAKSQQMYLLRMKNNPIDKKLPECETVYISSWLK